MKVLVRIIVFRIVNERTNVVENLTCSILKYGVIWSEFVPMSSRQWLKLCLGWLVGMNTAWAQTSSPNAPWRVVEMNGSHIQSNAQLPGVVVQFGCGLFGGNPQGVVVSDVDGTIPDLILESECPQDC